MKNNIHEYYPEFYTATILNWNFLLQEESFKIIIIDTLRFLVNQNRIKLYGFVIMSNHVHIIWQPLNGFTNKKNRNSFLIHTAKMFKEKVITIEKSNKIYNVQKPDRLYQFWKRNSLGIELYSDNVFKQKLNYIHNNPVKAKMVKFSEEYYYSSASFYRNGIDNFNMLTLYNFT